MPNHRQFEPRPPFPASTADYTDRLVHLLSVSSALREDSRNLVSQLRGSIHEMRELRGQLRSQRGAERTAEPLSRHDDLCVRFGLTRRESDVARLLARGQSNASIARQLRISAHTARHHTQSILSKLAVHSRGEAAAKLRGSA
jgi:DNA-binding NarL/FixJ family response regulator